MQGEGAAAAREPTEADLARAAETERRLQEAFQEVVSCASLSSSRPSLCPARGMFADSSSPRCADASIEAPPSLLPQKRYCDVTGLEVRARPSLPCPPTRLEAVKSSRPSPHSISSSNSTVVPDAAVQKPRLTLSSSLSLPPPPRSTRLPALPHRPSTPTPSRRSGTTTPRCTTSCAPSSRPSSRRTWQFAARASSCADLGPTRGARGGQDAVARVVVRSIFLSLLRSRERPRCRADSRARERKRASLRSRGSRGSSPLDATAATTLSSCSRPHRCTTTGLSHASLARGSSLPLPSASRLTSSHTPCTSSASGTSNVTCMCVIASSVVSARRCRMRAQYVVERGGGAAHEASWSRCRSMGLQVTRKAPARSWSLMAG